MSSVTHQPANETWLCWAQICIAGKHQFGVLMKLPDALLGPAYAFLSVKEETHLHAYNIVSLCLFHQTAKACIDCFILVSLVNLQMSANLAVKICTTNYIHEHENSGIPL